MPGHASLDENEAADRLAGKAAAADQPYVLVDFVSAKGAIDRHVRRMTETRYAAVHPSPAPTSSYQELPRQDSATLSQLRAGISPLTRNRIDTDLYRIGLAATTHVPRMASQTASNIC